MKILRKCIAFALAAGLMVSAMTVFADSGYSYKEATGSEDISSYDFSKGGLIQDWEGKVYQGLYTPNDAAVGTKWMNMNKGEESEFHTFEFDGTNWVYKGNTSAFISSGYIYNGVGLVVASESDSGLVIASGFDESTDSGAGTLTPEEIAAIQSRAEAEAVQHAASDEGFTDVGDMFRAAEKGMSAGEFYNNAVVSTPGIENAMTVGQGGNLVVNGKVTNMSATISKVTNRAYVDSVRIEQEGTVLNVVDVSYPAVEATINFYTPGITDGMEIVALQYNAGTWVNVEVAEVRADHVVLNMKGNGVVAFIAK